MGITSALWSPYDFLWFGLWPFPFQFLNLFLYLVGLARFSVITSLIPPFLGSFFLCVGHLPTFSGSPSRCFVLGSWVRAVTVSNLIDIFPQDQRETTNTKQKYSLVLGFPCISVVPTYSLLGQGTFSDVVESHMPFPLLRTLHAKKLP